MIIIEFTSDNTLNFFMSIYANISIVLLPIFATLALLKK